VTEVTAPCGIGQKASGTPAIGSVATDYSSVGPFGRLSPEARDIIRRGSTVRDYGADQALWIAGSVPKGIYLILEGSVRIVRGAGGRQHVIHAEEAGALIGEVPLFDGGPYPATALAGSRTRCLFVPREVLERAIATDPSLAWALLRGLSRRIRVLVEGLSSATLRTVRARLAGYLIDRSGPDARVVVTLGGSQAEIAETLGTVREVISRELSTLRRRGIVRAAGRRGYEIIDRIALEEIVHGRT